jgi:hypothetical protein
MTSGEVLIYRAHYLECNALVCCVGPANLESKVRLWRWHLHRLADQRQAEQPHHPVHVSTFHFLNGILSRLLCLHIASWL